MVAGENAQKSLFHLYSRQILWVQFRGDVAVVCDWDTKMQVKKPWNHEGQIHFDNYIYEFLDFVYMTESIAVDILASEVPKYVWFLCINSK